MAASAGGAGPSTTAAQIAALDHPLLKVPYDKLCKVFRATRKLIDAEMQTVVSEIEGLMKQAQGSVSAPAIKASLAALIERLQQLKQRVEGADTDEALVLACLQARVAHLRMGISTKTPGEAMQWNSKRLDRILVDHLLRDGRYETADEIVKDGRLEALVDIELFDVPRRIEMAFRQKDCSAALQWCEQNRPRLKRLKSTLEFKIRMQEYIEVVRAGSQAAAIAYAQQHFPQYSTQHLQDIKAAMGLLVRGGAKTAKQRAKYEAFFADDRWADLIQQFRRNNFAVSSLMSQSLLTITLQAGLASLKQPQCYDAEQRNKNCPVCSENMNTLAEGLPFAHHVNSKLVCHITGAIMNEDNPPTALPNGHVYGAEALQSMLAQTGRVKCPRTGQIFQQADLRKVYVM